MNVMKEAHKEAKSLVAARLNIKYRMALRLALIKCHKEYKDMKAQAEAFRLDTIAKFEKRVVELKIILNTPVADKFMVVCGDPHPMPINFEAENAKWPWAQVEEATKWNSIQFANANASKVVNGNQQVGKAVKVGTHIEWDIAQLEKLINELKSA